MQHIDKEIFKQEGVTKRLQPLNKWYYILSALGIACTALYLLAPNLAGFVSALVLMGLAVGDLCLLIAICYYLFGDCRKPYDKDSETFLERSFNYYPGTSQQLLAEALEGGSLAEIEKIKSCPTSDLMMVRYSNEKNGECHCQLLRQQESKEVPLTATYKIK